MFGLFSTKRQVVEGIFNVWHRSTVSWPFYDWITGNKTKNLYELGKNGVKRGFNFCLNTINNLRAAVHVSIK